MRMEITEKQAMKMANNIYSSNFQCYGVGNFNLSIEEFARLLMVSFNNDNKEKPLLLYEQLSRIYMGR